MTGRTVLVIEHNPLTRQIVRRTLGDEGFTVIEASEGREAIALLASSTPDLILQDLRLPDIDGLDLVSQLRALPRISNVPIIAFSGFLSRVEYGRAANVGFTDLLPKPVEPWRLLHVVKSHFPATPAGEPGEPPRAADDVQVPGEIDPVQIQLARLERQAALNTALAHRSAMHASMMSVIASISQTLTQRHRLDDALPEVLASLLDASNVSRGALFMPVSRANGRQELALATTNGFSEPLIDELEHFCGHSELLEEVAARRSALVLGLASDPPSASHVLARLGGGSALLVPLVTDDACLGMLLLLSSAPDLAGPDWIPFAHAMSVQIGQALALGRAVAELAESEARYRRIIETTNEGVWMIDASFKTTFLNARMAEMLGCEVQEAIGRSPSEFLDEEGLAAFARDAELMRAGLATQIEVRFVRRDGTHLCALLGSSPSVDRHGRPDGALAMVMDVTKRKVAEEARLVSETRFQRLWDSGMVLITISDADGTIRELNPAGERMLGYTRAELTADNVRWADLTPPAWAQGDVLAQAQLAACGVSAAWEKELIRKDGRRVPLLTSAATLDGGQRIAIAIDLTEAKRTEAELRLMETLALEASKAADLPATLAVVLKMICETAGWTFGSAWVPDAAGLQMVCPQSWVCDPANRTRLAPLIAMGLSAPGGLIDRVWRTQEPIWVDDLAREPACSRSAAAAACGIHAGLIVPVTSDGQVIAVIEFYLSELHDEDARFIKLVTTAAAQLAWVIARKAAEASRQLAESATMELEAQLLQAQKMEAVGRLAGGIAHDFNNLLSVILSYGEMVVEDLEVGEPMREDVEAICKAGRRAAELTRQLLMFSRQQVVAPKVIDLNELLGGLHKMLQRILGADVELVSLPMDTLGNVHVDPGSMEQVIMNLVVNARDAMPTGGTLTIATSNVILDEEDARVSVGGRAGRYVVLGVTDTGSGMDAQTQARIFEPFFTTKMTGKGTGLGLSTVFGIAHQCGGHVQVTSAPGQGSTFQVFLPRVDAVIDVDQASDPLSVSLRGDETILLVEDDQQVRRVARGILRRFGYTVLEAASAGEALLLTESTGEIDLLLSDVVMPQMSGPQLAKRLAKDRPAMKILCMSGYTDDRIIRHGVRDGEIAFLQKPITPDTLARKVREVLDAT